MSCESGHLERGGNMDTMERWNREWDEDIEAALLSRQELEDLAEAERDMNEVTGPVPASWIKV